MHDLEQEIGHLVQARLTGRIWLKRLFWETLDLERVNLPVPFDVLSVRDRDDLGDVTLWAERSDIQIVLCRLQDDLMDVEIERMVSTALSRTWRHSVILFSNASESAWDCVICCPRKSGEAASVRRIPNFGAAHTPRMVVSCLARLSPESEVPPIQALQEFYRVGLPFGNPADAVLYGLPRWLRIKLLGSDFEVFLHQAAGHPLLTKSEEFVLGHRIQGGDRDAWRELVACNIRLAIWGTRYSMKRGLEFEDLVQHSLMGVMKAADRFEPERGNRFSTFAYHWMRQMCERACQVEISTVRVPAHHHPLLARARRLRDRSHGAIPDAFCELEESDARLAQNLIRVTELLELDPDEHVVFEEAEADLDPSVIVTNRHLETERWNRICEALSETTLRDQEVLFRRFGLNGYDRQTLEEAGVALGITRERVRQIETRQLRMLRRVLPGQWPALFDEFVVHENEEEEAEEANQNGQDRSHNLSDVASTLLSMIRSHPQGLSAMDIGPLCRLQSSDRKAALRSLIASGLIQKEGRGRISVYRPAPTVPAPTSDD